MARSTAREHVWLQCTETGDLNYRIEIPSRGGVPERLQGGVNKYCPRLRKHTKHKVKRK